MTATRRQFTSLHAQLARAGVTDRTEKLAVIAGIVGRQITSSKDLTVPEANAVQVELARRASVVTT